MASLNPYARSFTPMATEQELRAENELLRQAIGKERIEREAQQRVLRTLARCLEREHEAREALATRLVSINNTYYAEMAEKRDRIEDYRLEVERLSLVLRGY